MNNLSLKWTELKRSSESITNQFELESLILTMRGSTSFTTEYSWFNHDHSGLSTIFSDNISNMKSWIIRHVLKVISIMWELGFVTSIKASFREKSHWYYHQYFVHIFIKWIWGLYGHHHANWFKRFAHSQITCVNL